MLRARGVYTHPPSRKEPTGAAKITTAAKRNAAQSKIKFRRPKQIRYKRIQPPKTILHTSLNTRKVQPVFRLRPQPFRVHITFSSSIPPLGKRSSSARGGENDRTEKAPNRQHKRSPEQIAPGFLFPRVLSLEAINARNTEITQCPFVELGMRSPVPISDSGTESRRPVERKTYRSPLEGNTQFGRAGHAYISVMPFAAHIDTCTGIEEPTTCRRRPIHIANIPIIQYREIGRHRTAGIGPISTETGFHIIIVAEYILSDSLETGSDTTTDRPILGRCRPREQAHCQCK